MGFYALWKWFTTFRKSNYPNMIYWFSKEKSKEYWHSLSDEEREEYMKKYHHSEAALKSILAGQIMVAMDNSIE